MVTVLEGGYKRYVSAQSRHDSGVCTCLDESGLCLSILVYLLDWSLSFLHLFLFLSFLNALAFIFFGTTSFSLPVLSFFPFWARAVVFMHGQHSVLVSRLSVCSLFGFEALFCVA